MFPSPHHHIIELWTCPSLLLPVLFDKPNEALRPAATPSLSRSKPPPRGPQGRPRRPAGHEPPPHAHTRCSRLLSPTSSSALSLTCGTMSSINIPWSTTQFMRAICSTVRERSQGSGSGQACMRPPAGRQSPAVALRACSRGHPALPRGIKPPRAAPPSPAAVRHLWLLRCGLDADAVAQKGEALALSELHLRYVQPLRSGDAVRGTARLSRSTGARLYVEQRIFRLPRPGSGESEQARAAKRRVLAPCARSCSQPPAAIPTSGLLTWVVAPACAAGAGGRSGGGGTGRALPPQAPGCPRRGGAADRQARPAAARVNLHLAALQGSAAAGCKAGGC